MQRLKVITVVLLQVYFVPGGETAKPKQLVVVCNGYTDTRPVQVGIRLPAGPGATHRRHGLRVHRPHRVWPAASMTPHKTAHIQLIPSVVRRKVDSSSRYATLPWEPVRPDTRALWLRPLAYGTCEEYHVDLTQRRLFFEPPGNLSFCELDPAAPSAKNINVTNASQLAVVVMQPQTSSRQCAVRSAVLGRHKDYGAAAELATFDAYTEAPPSAGLEAEAPEEVEMDREDVKKGLDRLPLVLDPGAVIHLEDKIEKDILATEIVGTLTVSLGDVRAVEPKELHVVLEDFRGARVLDRKDVEFEAGRTYIAIRSGRSGDAVAFPQQLFVYPCVLQSSIY